MNNLQGCVSNETPSGKLTDIGDEAAFLKNLKADPRQVLVSAITAPTTPYSIEMIQQGSDIEPHPSVVHSCTQNSGEYGDPAVRIQQWVDAFGANGLSQTICANSFAPALQLIANQIAGIYAPPCVSGPFPPTAPGAQPACRVADQFFVNGTLTRVPLPNCASSAQLPCWRLVDDASGCLDGKRLVLDRGATVTPPPDLTTAFTCAPCAPGSTEVGCP